MTIISRTTSSLPRFSSGQVAILSASLVALGVWLWSRVGTINPAILGDEYLYSMNARKSFGWGDLPSGDFSNYLFNFVYSSSNYCGEAFYACAKGLNIVFFLGFLALITLAAARTLPFVYAIALTWGIGLSPLSVYTSMFLPESMFMFFIGLTFLLAVVAMDRQTHQSWIVVGIALGLSALVKPHAFLSLTGLTIALLVVGLATGEHRVRRAAANLGALLAAFLMTRVFVGLAIAGPKSLGLFGQYASSKTITQIAGGPRTEDFVIGQEIDPMAGVVQLFGPQAVTHIFVIAALVGLSLVALSANVIHMTKSGTPSSHGHTALLALIWASSLMIEVVAFTGWITGSGDDHTSRVLLRYYEFALIFVVVGGLSVLHAGVLSKISALLRWVLAFAGIAILTPAFSGHFDGLEVQIADAPGLAGLIVSREVFGFVATLTFLGMLVLAAFPKMAFVPVTAITLSVLVTTGFQIQNQYILFRGEPEAADRAGHYLYATFSEENRRSGLILSTSRFEATNVAFWADSPELQFEVYGPGSIYDFSLAPDGTAFIVATSGIEVTGEGISVQEFEGFTLYEK